MVLPVLILVLPSPTSINFTRLFDQRSYYKNKPNHHQSSFLKTISSSSGGGQRHSAVARAMESSSSSGVDIDGAPKGTDPAAQFPASGFSLPDHIPGWVKLALGAVFLLTLPFYRRILRVEGAIEKGAEKAAQIVEKVAEEVAEFAKDVASVLPAGALKEKIEKIEHIAAEVGKDAQVAEAVIEKVDEITDNVEALVEGSDDHHNGKEEVLNWPKEDEDHRSITTSEN